MNDEKEQREPLGVARVLPDHVALALARAGRLARELPVDSLERVKIIRDAERKAKEEYPSAFTQDDGGGFGFG